MKRVLALAAIVVFFLGCQSVPPVEQGNVQEESEPVVKVSPEPQQEVEEVVQSQPEIEEVEKPLSWNDSVPFGQIGDDAIEVPILREERQPYMIPEIGPVLAGDKAGPEFFILINQAAFNGEGHVRGVQYDWWQDENDKLHMTLDLTGPEVVVKNASYGEESGYGAEGRTIWPGDVVYQIFFPFNGDRELTYLEYEYKGQYYYMGEYRE